MSPRSHLSSRVSSISEGRWRAGVAASASLLLSLPLIINGSPEVEQYYRSVFSTVSFARNLAAGVDPWFVPDYGFGLSLPSSTWLVKFPPAIPAALLGIDVLYAAIWVTGTFVFAWYFLKLSASLVSDRWVSGVMLLSAILSFSSLGPTYVDDWPTYFLGWALLPACLWFVIQTLLQSSSGRIMQQAALCTVALVIFVGSAHQNQIVTVYSGLGVFLLYFANKRPASVFAVGIAAAVALLSGADVLVPSIHGMLQAGINPFREPIPLYEWSNDHWTIAEPTATSYKAFLEPVWSVLTGERTDPESGGYVRMPFFGLCAVVLAVVGAFRAFASGFETALWPKDIVRGIALGFAVNSAATLMPSWVIGNVPRMYLYRDAQAVFGLLCAGMALGFIRDRLPRLFRPMAVLQVLQVAAVALPIIGVVLLRDDGADPLFAYARGEHVLFDGLNRMRLGASTRILLTEDLEALLNDEDLADVGVTAGTDFSLEGIAVVNASYRGALTPRLGGSTRAGRYGAYETLLTWRDDLQYLTPEGMDVLGITHVLALEDDRGAIERARGLTPRTAIEFPGRRRIVVLENEDAWGRASLLRGAIETPPHRPNCPTNTVSCLDYSDLSQTLTARPAFEWRGSSLRVTLPAAHSGGTLFVSQVAGTSRTASVDGRPREVRLLLETFPMLQVLPGERTVVLSFRRTDRILLSVLGFIILAACVVLAVVLWRTGRVHP
jgi:hypothetical protein